MARASIRKIPSYEFLHRMLSYDQDTGDLRWRLRSGGKIGQGGDASFNGKYAGKVAGTISVGRPDGSNKYLVVGLRFEGKYQQYPAHRIIWKMMTGDEPPP